MRILLLTPPMTQLNTPYPATAYLKGFLRARGIEAAQADPALELFLNLFSREGLARIRGAYRPTAKNGVAADLYLRLGFREVEAGVIWELDLAAAGPLPSAIRVQ